MADLDPRILAAWREWLSALASDPEAAIAAAHVYDALSAEGRDAWLTALEEDSPKLGVPTVALYAPLLSVESDPARIERIRLAMVGDVPPVDLQSTVALRGVAPDRTRIAVLVAPLYVQFVQVLSVRFSPHTGFVWVSLDPILRASDAPTSGHRIDGVTLEHTPLKPVVEELALAILAQRRQGQELPRSMVGFAGLFDARIDNDSSA
ncbi:MAG: hypothetical protein HOV80_07355 [Polyangiaceae bacterium]|nr:hypothetical protein [Polyangiaceae bacterium]